MNAVGFILAALFFFAGVFIYIALIRQISTRTPESADESIKTFGVPEAIVAALLISFLLLNVFVSVSGPTRQLSSADLATNLFLFLAIVVMLAGFLKLRGLDFEQVGGFSRIGFPRALTTGAVLLIAAWPLVSLTDALAQRLFGSGRQDIIEFFNASGAIQQRILIIVLAVAIAPMVEEFLFRFFLYGIFRRYFGRFVGIIVNATLFAVVHAHLPAVATLFVLGVCFTLAYEWSGSILVAMSMHALFNAIQLTVLAFYQQ